MAIIDNTVRTMSADEQARRTYEAWRLGIVAPHSSVFHEGSWCNFWTSSGLWDEAGMPSEEHSQEGS